LTEKSNPKKVFYLGPTQSHSENTIHDLHDS